MNNKVKSVKKRKKGKDILMFITGFLSVVYLINPDAGIFEFIPDVLPFIGNIDEVAATTFLLGVLSYFGFDVKGFFGRNFFVREEKDEVKKIDMKKDESKK